MYRRRKPLRNRPHQIGLETLNRNVPRFSFYQIRDEIRATSDVVIALSRDRVKEVSRFRSSSGPVGLTLV